MVERVCVGPDGSNLLGFLAAVGALVSLDRAWPERGVRMSWKKEGPWHPVLRVEGEATEAEIANALYCELKGRAIEVRGEDGELASNTSDLTDSSFRSQADGICRRATWKERLNADFLSAIASDAIREKDGKLSDTALRTLGGGQQKFFGTMRNLVEKTTCDDITTALFRRWEYREGEGKSLRYDPREDRRYALRATDPSKESVVTVPGANRLAVEALNCFPTFPVGKRLRTTGFVNGKDLIWPIWETLLSRRTLGSLLLRNEVYRYDKERNALRAIGVAQVYKSTRINTGLNGAYRNFTPAIPCM